MKLTEFLADKKSRCPACRLRLDVRRRATVVASGRCPRCTAPVIDDLPPLPEKSVFEFASLRRRPPGIFNVHTLVPVFFGLAGYGALWGLVTLSVWLSDRASILVASVVSAVSSIGVALFLWEMFKKWRFRDWKSCPHCGKRMNPKFVLPTGRCHHCAAGLLAEADRPGTPVMTREVLIRRNDHLQWQFLLGGALLVVVGTAAYHLVEAFGISIPGWLFFLLFWSCCFLRWPWDYWHRQPCPGCGANLLDASTVDYCAGNCQWCGYHAVSPPEKSNVTVRLRRQSLIVLLVSAGLFAGFVWLWIFFGPWDSLTTPSDDDLRPSPPIAIIPTDNAWTHFAAAWKAMPAERCYPQRSFCCGQHAFQGKGWEDAKVADYLSSYQAVFAELDKGVACQVCQPSADALLSKDDKGEPHYLALSSRLVSALSLQAEDFRRHKRFDEAAATSRKMIRYGILMQKRPPDTFSWLYGASAIRHGLKQIKELAADPGAPFGLLISVEREIRPYSTPAFWQPSLNFAMRSEYMQRRDAILHVDPWEMGTIETDKKNRSTIQCNFFCQPRRTCKMLAEKYRRYLAQIERGEPDKIPSIRERFSWKTFPASNIMGYITVILTVDLGTYTLQDDKLATIITLTRLALLCKAYEKQHGALPETLQALVPDDLDAVPRDLWDGQPIRYSKARRLLYSVGPDGKDDRAVMDDHGSCSKDQVLELK